MQGRKGILLNRAWIQALSFSNDPIYVEVVGVCLMVVPGVRKKTANAWVLLWLMAAAGSSHARDTVLALMPLNEKAPSHATFMSAYTGFTEGLEGECQVFLYPVTKASSTEELRQWLDVVNPDLVLLMDARAVQLYLEFKRENLEREPFLPAVIVMSLFVENQVAALGNATAIEYQTPAVITLVNFRSLLKKPLEKVGVLYRRDTRYFFEKQKELCRPEGIDLFGIMVDEKGKRLTTTRVRSSLKKLVLKEKVDAIWVLNDGKMLTRKMLENAWLSIFDRYKVPIAVGNEHFVSESGLIGQFAVVPDPRNMGNQAAEIVLDIRDENWRIGEPRVHSPYSVHKMLNLNKISEEMLVTGNLSEVDKIIKKE